MSSTTNMRNWTEFELNAVLALICKGTNLNDHISFAAKLNKALHGRWVDKDIPRSEVRKLLDYFEENHQQTMNLLKRQGVPNRITRLQKLAFARAFPPWDPTLEEGTAKRSHQKMRVSSRAKKEKTKQRLAAAIENQVGRVRDTPVVNNGKGTVTTAQKSYSSSSNNTFVIPAATGPSKTRGDNLSPAARGGVSAYNLPSITPAIPTYTHNTAAAAPSLPPIGRNYSAIGSHHSAHEADTHRPKDSGSTAPALALAPAPAHAPTGHYPDPLTRLEGIDLRQLEAHVRPRPGHGYGDHPYYDPNWRARKQQAAYRERVREAQRASVARREQRHRHGGLPGLRDPSV